MNFNYNCVTKRAKFYLPRYIIIASEITCLEILFSWILLKTLIATTSTNV